MNPWKDFRVDTPEVQTQQQPTTDEDREEAERRHLRRMEAATKGIPTPRLIEMIAEATAKGDVRHPEGLTPEQMAQETQAFRDAVKDLGDVSEAMRCIMGMSEEDAAKVSGMHTAEEWRESVQGKRLASAAGSVAFGEAFCAWEERQKAGGNGGPTIH